MTATSSDIVLGIDVGTTAAVSVGLRAAAGHQQGKMRALAVQGQGRHAAHRRCSAGRWPFEVAPLPGPTHSMTMSRKARSRPSPRKSW